MHDAHERLLAKIAHLYYIEDKQQSDIARSLNLSRSKVCRMLSEAHSQGIVEIHVKPKLSLHVDLEAQLEKKYNLKEVVVTESEAGRPLTQTLGLAGAQILKRLMTSQDVLGISWGANIVVDRLQLLRSRSSGSPPRSIGRLPQYEGAGH